MEPGPTTTTLLPARLPQERQHCWRRSLLQQKPAAREAWASWQDASPRRGGGGGRSAPCCWRDTLDPSSPQRREQGGERPQLQQEFLCLHSSMPASNGEFLGAGTAKSTSHSKRRSMQWPRGLELQSRTWGRGWPPKHCVPQQRCWCTLGTCRMGPRPVAGRAAVVFSGCCWFTSAQMEKRHLARLACMLAAGWHSALACSAAGCATAGILTLLLWAPLGTGCAWHSRAELPRHTSHVPPTWV